MLKLTLHRMVRLCLAVANRLRGAGGGRPVGLGARGARGPCGFGSAAAGAAGAGRAALQVEGPDAGHRQAPTDQRGAASGSVGSSVTDAPQLPLSLVWGKSSSQLAAPAAPWSLRHYMPPEAIEQVLSLMAASKLNVLHLHLVDRTLARVAAALFACDLLWLLVGFGFMCGFRVFNVKGVKHEHLRTTWHCSTVPFRSVPSYLYSPVWSRCLMWRYASMRRL